MIPTESQLRENYAAKDTEELLELRSRDTLTELALRVLDEVCASRGFVAPHSRPGHAQLVVDSQSAREYDMEVLRKNKNIGRAKSMVLVFIVVSAYPLGVLDYFVIPLLLLLLCDIIYFGRPHWRSGEILSRLRSGENESFIGGNEIAQQSVNGKIIAYHRSAACIYPGCRGKIVLSDPPEDERRNTYFKKDCVGICSLAGRSHSYRIDCTWNAFPAQFDWTVALDGYC